MPKETKSPRAVPTSKTDLGLLVERLLLHCVGTFEFLI